MSKVALRKKKISKGRLSLYLDIYPKIIHPSTGRLTRYKFLGLYLFAEPRNMLEKNHNKQTLDLAINVCANVQLEVQNKRFGFVPDSKRDGNFLDFFESCLKGRAGSDLATWKSAMLHFKSFIGGSLPFRQMNEMLCIRFRSCMEKAPFLKRKNRILNINSVSSYIGKFKNALKEAFRRRLLLEDLGSSIRIFVKENLNVNG